jgi:hypothetical protein
MTLKHKKHGHDKIIYWALFNLHKDLENHYNFFKKKIHHFCKSKFYLEINYPYGKIFT